MAFSLCYLALCGILGLVRSSRRDEFDKDIELMVLRHEVRILERQAHGRVRYRRVDRAIFALSRLLPPYRPRSFLVTPETLLRWHRAAVKAIGCSHNGVRIVSAKANKPATASFATTLSAMGNNTGIEVPEDLIEALGAGKRPPVHVNVNGYDYQSTVGVMAGKSLISVNAAVRAATGLKGGDAIQVTLTVADKPRPVETAADFHEALDAHEPARAFFDTLSNSLQRFHIDNINGTKTAETRQRRIEKSISLFLECKKR